MSCCATLLLAGRQRGEISPRVVLCDTVATFAMCGWARGRPCSSYVFEDAVLCASGALHVHSSVRSAALFECRDSALQRFRVTPLSGVPTGERRGVTCLVRKAL